MQTATVRSVLLVTLACAAAAPDAMAQSSSRDRERARAERERLEREREWDREWERRERERETRARLERERQTRLQRERLERERLARERRDREVYARQLAERGRRDRSWYDSDRPRVSLGGGIDVRRFDGEDDRFLVQGGVDFRMRSGLGMRPEVFYAWTDRGAGSQIITDAVGRQIGTVDASGRSRALGVSVNATYTFLRGMPVRPYILGGVGLVSTREPALRVTSGSFPGLPAGQLGTPTRRELDVGLNTGAGLEFALGPVRLFSEVRYFLTDTPTARGFSGMLPITAGIRF
jgi:opacity protein-like surface antigen